MRISSEQHAHEVVAKDLPSDHHSGWRRSYELEAAWGDREVTDRREELPPSMDDPGGQVLATLLGQPWVVGLFLRVGVAVATALSGLHARGLVHRDVNPSNILVDLTSGGAWLTGFGLTTRLARGHHPPRPQEGIVGTLAYMAPEQTGRMNRSVDTRADLYALGVTLYEMLTGSVASWRRACGPARCARTKALRRSSPAPAASGKSSRPRSPMASRSTRSWKTGSR